MIQTISRPHCRRLKPVSVASVVCDNNSLIKQYLEWKRSYAPRAAVAYGVWIKRFQKFTNKAPEALMLGDWTAFAQSLDGRFAPKSVEYALNIIHNYLRFWHEQGRLRQLPLYLVRVPKAIARSHSPIKEEDYCKIVGRLRGGGKRSMRDLTIVMLLHDTGMRVGELVELEIEKIEENASTVIRSEKTVQRRRVFWNKDTDEVLRRYIVSRSNSKRVDELLFPLTPRSVQRIVARAAAFAGIKHRISPHSFRHAYIHRLAALGTPDAIIAQLVGHSTPHSIAHYTKLSRSEFEQFARKQFQSMS